MVRRVPLAAAVAFAVLSVFAVVVVPLGPGTDRTGSEVVAHITAHAGMIRLQVLLSVCALLAAAVVFAHARERLDGPAGHLFTMGAAVLIAQVGIQMWFSAGLALHPGSLDPAVARILSDIASMFGPLLTVAAILLAGPVVWAGRRGRFPRWMTLIAAVFVVEQFVELLTIIGPVGSFIAPGGPMTLFGGGVLFGVFIFGLGMSLGLPDRDPQVQPEPVPRPAEADQFT
ncbi:hypothetical protein [Mycolicibacterium sp.]|jgi:hypothetical protein|uniref:hypothetical protein n=1 Tax=Mycolicibacterium sp. TaxID=2320850 RepID=UPI0028A888A7|nr:hypothetical protein [Mycolicibacterium sp.]